MPDAGMVWIFRSKNFPGNGTTITGKEVRWPKTANQIAIEHKVNRFGITDRVCTLVVNVQNDRKGKYRSGR